ncbi:MAG: type II toxin-antitoxin system HicA family toxin [Actinobacteria bacterium]|nr:MAG: type II toxin-antitoxin system HicA family toxin [Actinomycetota bacterium]
MIGTLRHLGFEVVRTGSHISLRGTLPDGSMTGITIPNHRHIKGATLRTACTLAGIDRDAFLDAHRRAGR